MKKLIIIALFLTATTAQAQTLSTPFSQEWDAGIQVTASPNSIIIVGLHPAILKVTVKHKWIQVIYMHARKTLYITREKKIHYGKLVRYEWIKKSNNWIGLFIMPFKFDWNNFHAIGGSGWFFKRFPVNVGTRINFTLQLSYMITNHIGIGYQHISNGFGLFNQYNIGVDNISLVYNF